MGHLQPSLCGEPKYFIWSVDKQLSNDRLLSRHFYTSDFFMWIFTYLTFLGAYCVPGTIRCKGYKDITVTDCFVQCYCPTAWCMVGIVNLF